MAEASADAFGCPQGAVLGSAAVRAITSELRRQATPPLRPAPLAWVLSAGSAATWAHEQALELGHVIASFWDGAHALASLGRCATAAGPHHAG